MSERYIELTSRIGKTIQLNNIDNIKKKMRVPCTLEFHGSRQHLDIYDGNSRYLYTYCVYMYFYFFIFLFEIHTSIWSLSLEWMVLINFLKVFLRNFLIVSWATSKTFLNFWIFFTNLLQLSYKILSYKKKSVYQYCTRKIWLHSFFIRKYFIRKF